VANNKTKIDRIHDLMPKYFRTRQNPNWKAIIEGIGNSDQNIADLIEEVRKQFFVKTASRPYIDRLGANVKVSRPRLIGMDDSDFRRYIPVLAYQPKQVKIAIDQLLDIFFFKESTTAFMRSEQTETYYLKDGWELNYLLDSIHDENIIFKTADFVDIANATAEEIVSAINRQAENSFAIVFDDSIFKTKSVRLFTNTIGSKGAIQILGGRANISLQFQGYNVSAGSQTSTQWNITKVGDTVTFQYVGGGTPNLTSIQTGDFVIIDIPNNEGSFAITDVDLAANSFTFTNILATPGFFDHGLNPNTFVRFFTPEKSVVYTKNLRAVTWEVSPGELVVEMPASPPIVKRKLAGSAHINGTIATIVTRLSDTSMQLDDASVWPTKGYFVLQPKNEIRSHIKTISEDEVSVYNFESRFDKAEQYYEYTGISGNVISGITPDLPPIAAIFEVNLTTAVRDAVNIVTANTATPHGFQVGDSVGILDTIPTISGTPAINLSDPIDGCFEVLSTPTPTSFTYRSFGDEGQATAGRAVVERIGLSSTGSLVYLTTARLDSRILGPYMWDLKAPFVLSALTTNLTAPVQAGDALRSISVQGPNPIPSTEGYLIFDFGTEAEEGPIRYLYKANDQTISIDPAYVFRNNHYIGASITMIRRRGAHVMSGLGYEYPLYITDPAIARPVLEELIRQVKSVGIFVNFIIRFPEQFYATLDVYGVGVDPG